MPKHTHMDVVWKVLVKKEHFQDLASKEVKLHFILEFQKSHIMQGTSKSSLL